MKLLACDMGGTRIKLGVIENYVVVAERIIPAHSDRGLADRLPAIVEAFQALCASRGTTIGGCDAIAISFPSLVDVSTGRILAAYGKYNDAPRLDLRTWAKSALGLPLAIENDARMALIGEWQHGAGRGCNDLVMITLGTGLGTSAVIEGKVLRGKHGQAGCLGGHLTVRYGGRRCNCGNIGCAEAEASTAFLMDLAQTDKAFAHSALASEPVLDYAAVIRHAHADDDCAKSLLDHSVQVWGSLAVSLIHAYDPERLVIGGGIMASRDILLPRLQDYVAQFAHTPWGKVKVVASVLGDQAALLAAEWLVREQCGPADRR
jgi:glucokinase